MHQGAPDLRGMSREGERVPPLPGDEVRQQQGGVPLRGDRRRGEEARARLLLPLDSLRVPPPVREARDQPVGVQEAPGGGAPTVHQEDPAERGGRDRPQDGTELDGADREHPPDRRDGRLLRAAVPPRPAGRHPAHLPALHRGGGRGQELHVQSEDQPGSAPRQVHVHLLLHAVRGELELLRRSAELQRPQTEQALPLQGVPSRDKLLNDN